MDGSDVAQRRRSVEPVERWIGEPERRGLPLLGVGDHACHQRCGQTGPAIRDREVLRRLVLREEELSYSERGEHVRVGGDVGFGPDQARTVAGALGQRLGHHAVLVARLGPDQAGTAAAGTVFTLKQPVAVLDHRKATRPAGLVHELVVLADGQRGAADQDGEWITRGLDSGCVAGGEVHPDALGGRAHQIGVHNLGQNRWHAGAQTPRVGADVGQRIVAAAGAIDGHDVRVEQPLHAVVAVVAAIAAHYELVRAGGHVVGALDVHLLFAVERVAAGVLAQRQFAVAERGGRHELIRLRVVLQGQEHVGSQAQFYQRDRLPPAVVVHVDPVGPT